ncbi:M23 family metallopeptidase [Catenovulum sp. SM1970]|uniref:M23 family metallopeptidase n=1 Tax=Marinifaba aquimaris TaxID=2741323 RepID=UPI00157167BC|nr:M23 family metallopeptidase [Marinifaba aquimaris]NTS78471.1 M23 family metallopeptidase [Marinifaba aquimaris]
MEQHSSRFSEPENSLYNLPFGVGESYELRQGNCTFHTHSVENKNEFAFDFIMDIGTPIHAARAGQVAAIEERFFDGNNKTSDFNYVAIAHEDGTFAFYIHITNSGVTVELGEFVEQGDVIAYSGDTGMESIPHLHFHVIELDDSCVENNVIGACSSIPISFKNASPNDKVLQQGVTYTAM